MFHPIILKFGGTSVQDAEAMRRAADIVRTHGITRRSRPLVVLSACAGVTNALIRISELSVAENTKQALAELDLLTARHADLARELLKDKRRLREVLRTLGEIWTDLRRLVRGVHLLNELTMRSRDHFLGAGERCSTVIFSAALSEAVKKEKIEVSLYDSRECFITDREFGHARPLTKEIEKRMKPIRAALQSGGVGVIQGFVGATQDSIPTTIGRGGSDFSAAIMGVAVHADEIQIWTDVAGIYTCDPRITPLAAPVSAVSFEEASALAYFGAKVLHPETIWPAIEKGIPVRVLSSKEPDAEGTLILEHVDESLPLTGIAFKRDVVLVKILPISGLPNVEAQAAVWRVFTSLKIVPLTATLSADSGLYVLENSGGATTNAQSWLRAELEGIADVEFEVERGLITLVGRGLQTSVGIALRIFKAVGKTNCELISYGGSGLAVSFVVPEDKAVGTVKRLHKEFFE